MLDSVDAPQKFEIVKVAVNRGAIGATAYFVFPVLKSKLLNGPFNKAVSGVLVVASAAIAHASTGLVNVQGCVAGITSCTGRHEVDEHCTCLDDVALVAKKSAAGCLILPGWWRC